MYRLTLTLFAFTLAACGSKDDAGGAVDADTDTDTDTDTDADTDTDTDSDTDTDVTDTDTDTVTDTDTDLPSLCDPITDGRWTVDGPAFGMEMEVDLVSDYALCTFDLGNWSMQMGPMPEGGTIAADIITFDGNAYWQTCSGTLTGGTEITGVCTGDGANFLMRRN